MSRIGLSVAPSIQVIIIIIVNIVIVMIIMLKKELTQDLEKNRIGLSVALQVTGKAGVVSRLLS